MLSLIFLRSMGEPLKQMYSIVLKKQKDKLFQTENLELRLLCFLMRLIQVMSLVS